MAKNALCIGINNYPGTHMDLQLSLIHIWTLPTNREV